VLEVVNTVPWSISFIQLAWTAGPVTLIAAAGGYYLGYGKPLPINTLIFFIGYTVIAGIIGMGAKVIHQATRGERERRQREYLTTAINRLPELIFAVRDLALENLTPAVRKREAAWQMLAKRELDPQATAVAVQDLTDSTHLAQTVRRVETYRRAGLRHRVADLLAEDEAQIQLVLEELAEHAPAMAVTLRQRIEGRGPDAKSGVPREENFIERVFAAADEENEALMTLADVEEMLVLAFELINGREIPMLGLVYPGRWRLARATAALEEARSEYRLAKARGYSRLKALATYLLEQEETELEEAIAGQPLPTLVEKVREAIDALCDHIYQLRVAVYDGDPGALDELETAVETLGNALVLYQAMVQGFQMQIRAHAGLLRARQRWESASEKALGRVGVLRTRGRGAGLRIEAQKIRLDDRQKLKVAEALNETLRTVDLRQRRRPGEEERRERLTHGVARRLAIDVALALDPFIDLVRPEVQWAIEASHAAYLGSLEPGLSVSAKAAYGGALVQEVRRNMGRAAERVAAALVRHYGVTLTEEAISFLHRTYGANRETLQVIADYQEPPPPAQAAQALSRPPPVPPVESAWERQLRRARRLLADFGREVG